MEPVKESWHKCTFEKCDDTVWSIAPRMCNDCKKKRTAERRAVAREAYMAALGGCCADPNIEKEILAVHFAQGVAIETIKQWDAFVAAVDAEGGE